uniref:hypothetical protein n=1 Tax=Kitasatospora sp. MBT63 TaxID=1444768 RepID=UPI00053B86E3
MTQDGFTAAERIAATLDALAETLLGERATHYPAATLAAFGSTAHPAAGALFGVRIGPNGPGITGVHGLGTVVEAAHTRRPEPAPGAAAELLARYGGGTVRGAAAPSAAAFRFPVGHGSADEKLRPEFPPALAALAADRPVLAPDELSTGSGVEARLLVPSLFHPLAIRGDGAALGAHLTEVAAELFAGADAEARKEWAVVAAALAEETAAAGVVFAGLATVVTQGRRSRASLVAALVPHAQEVGELATELADRRPAAEVWRVLLPAGPAVLLVEPRTVPVPAPLTADGRPLSLVGVTAEAFLPLPDGRSVLTVQLSTAQADDWELYTGVFARVLESVQLAWDGQVHVAAQPPQVQQPAAAPVQAAPPAPVAAPPVPPA